MAYQSIHTGTDIDDGISINSTQNDRLTNLENKSNSYLPLSGGTMAGAINMNSQPISGLNNPTEDSQAANKEYVDKIADDLAEVISKYPKVLQVPEINTSNTTITFTVRPQIVLCIAHGYDKYPETVPGASAYLIAINSQSNADIGAVLLSNSSPNESLIISALNISGQTLTVTWKRSSNRICWFIPFA